MTDVDAVSSALGGGLLEEATLLVSAGAFARVHSACWDTSVSRILVTCWIVPRGVLFGRVISCLEWLEMGTFTYGHRVLLISRRPSPTLSCPTVMFPSMGSYKTGDPR